MRIGLIVGLHGRNDRPESTAPSWETVQGQVLAAETAGFDLAVFEDALLYQLDEGVVGFWECVSMLGAVAASTSAIEFGPSVFNSPYRTPAFVAKIADTLDEISGGRFILGLGAGNTPDYEAFGFPPDKRYSRFEEAIQIIHGLVKEGSVDFDGDYQSARKTVLYPRGPREGGLPIVIAAGGPKMLRLTARYADQWNWFALDKESSESLPLLSEEMDRACDEVGRDRTTLGWSIDVYNVDPLGISEDDDSEAIHIGGSSAEIAARLLEFDELGIDEVRVNLDLPADHLAHSEVVEAMAEVVSRVHLGRPSS